MILLVVKILLQDSFYLFNFRITGLDPARALFEGSLGVQSGLDRTCAKFVDIIHSDPGGYGTSKPAGTVDIWPNFAGTATTQPGCPEGSFEMFSPEGEIYFLLQLFHY